MRKQYDSLAAIVVAAMGKDPHDGALYLFVGRDRRRAKVLYFDGTGVCVFAKRLEKGRFASLWSADATTPLTMTTSELSLFLEGSELIGKIALSPPAFDRRVDLHTHASKFSRV
jgi:transposase